MLDAQLDLLLPTPDATLGHDAEHKATDSLGGRARQSALGQFMTPKPLAAFAASLFPGGDLGEISLLDAGAGEGTLATAFLDRVARGDLRAAVVSVRAVESDPAVLPALRDALARHPLPGLRVEVVEGDFLAIARPRVAGDGGHTHALLNPPYKKIGSRSAARARLSAAGVEASNLYTGFLALALLSLRRGGHLCAIVPRSFCNGPYHRAFRRLLLRHGALRRAHVFRSRTSAFAGDGVLQETVVVLVERGGQAAEVEVSASTDVSLADLSTARLPPCSVVRPGDPDAVIHLPDPGAGAEGIPAAFRATLADLGLGVSTGPVVDFRLREHLRPMPGPGDAPLIYPAHLDGGRALRWPLPGGRKPNAIRRCPETERWLFPHGTYAVVRRVSAKEERRRVVACAVPASALPSGPVGFENHLNVVHRRRGGLPDDLCAGLVAYLNSTMVDAHFRTFSGHTQVNARDLRSIPCPPADALAALGRRLGATPAPNQGALDEAVRALATA